MKNRSGEKVKLTSIDEMLGVLNEESAMEIEISRIHSFKDHPFKVLDDGKMQDLVEHAAAIAGLTTIPAIIREMSDDEAVIAMVDANIQREELLPSEKAYAFKMKLDAMKHQGGRTDITSGQNGQKLKGTVSRDILAEQVGESSKQIQRYIRLTELIPELLELVDKKKLQFTVAVDISYLDREIQKWIYEYIRDNGFIKPGQISALRKHLETETISQNFMISIFNNCIAPKTKNRKVTISEKKLTKYFPLEYSEEQMERIIVGLLEKWKTEQEG